jgi:tetratricopeptide (TPR) repeat protein
MKQAFFCILLFFIFGVNFTRAQQVSDYLIYKEKADRHIQNNQFDSAITELNQALNLMPYDLDLIQERAFCYMQLNNYHAAIKDYSYVLDKKAYLEIARFQRGEAYYYSKQYAKAAKDFSLILSQNPHHKKAHAYLKNIVNNYLNPYNRE